MKDRLILYFILMTVSIFKMMLYFILLTFLVIFMPIFIFIDSKSFYRCITELYKILK